MRECREYFGSGRNENCRKMQEDICPFEQKYSEQYLEWKCHKTAWFMGRQHSKKGNRRRKQNSRDTAGCTGHGCLAQIGDTSSGNENSDAGASDDELAQIEDICYDGHDCRRFESEEEGEDLAQTGSSSTGIAGGRSKGKGLAQISRQGLAHGGRKYKKP